MSNSALQRLLAQRKASQAAQVEPAKEAEPVIPVVVVDDSPTQEPAPEPKKFEATKAEVQEDGTTIIEAKTEEAQKETATSSAGQSTHPLKLEMAELEAALNANVPDFANKLREIHIKLRKDPAIVTLLSEDEIGVIVSGLERHVNIEIVSPKTKKAGSKKLIAGPLDASDL